MTLKKDHTYKSLDSTRRKISQARKRWWKTHPGARKALSQKMKARFPPKPPAPPPMASGAKNQKHGLTPALRRIKQKGLGALDQRSKLALGMKKLRAELMADLGGEESLSAGQKKLIEDCVKKMVMLESIDAWLFSQSWALINKRTASLRPIVLQRATLSDSLMRCLRELGLEKKAKNVPSIQDYIQQAGSVQ
jgi:hypothetical protein